MSQIYKSLTSGPVPPSVPTSFEVKNIGVSAGISVPVANLEIFNSVNSALVLSIIGNTINFDVSGAAENYVQVTGPVSYDVLSTDYFISCDSSAGAITINLPDAPTDLQQFIIKDRTGGASSHNITVKSISGVTTIDQQSTYVFVDNFESLECLYKSANYEIF